MSDQDIADAKVVEKVRGWLALLALFFSSLIDKLLKSVLITFVLLLILVVFGFSYQLYNDVAISATFDLIPMKK